MAHGQLSGVIQFLRRTVGAVPTDEATDRQLLAQFAARRDEDAFAALARRHGPMVLAVCRRVLGDDHAAEDAFQAAFLVLARKAGSAGWHESVGSWLYQVAVRVAQKARGDAARRRLHERQVSDMAIANADTEAIHHELRAVLDEELTRLPEKYRAPLVLCYLEGKTNEEAAAQLGWTKGTVSGRLARARDLLRGRLARRGLALAAAALPAAVTETASAAIVPVALLNQTIRAAATGAAVAPVAVLAEGALRTMFWMKLKIAAVVLLGLGVIGTGTGIVAYRALAAGQGTIGVAAASPLPEPERTKTMPEEKTIASKPVRVNGVDFQVVTERHWVAPAPPATSRPIELGLRVTNRTGGELVFFDDTVQFFIRSLDGKLVSHFVTQALVESPPDANIKIAPSESLTIGIRGSLANLVKGGLHYMADPRRASAALQGNRKYNVSLSYGASGTDIKNLWQGEVRTAEVQFEVIEKLTAAASPLPEPDGKANAEAKEMALQIGWTSGVLTAKGTYGWTYKFHVQKDGMFQYSGKPFGKYDGKPYEQVAKPQPAFEGKFPKEATESLIALIASAKNTGPRAVPGVVGGTVHCSWLDKSGKQQKKQFSINDPDNGQAVQKKLEELARQYGRSSAKAPPLEQDRTKTVPEDVEVLRIVWSKTCRPLTEVYGWEFDFQVKKDGTFRYDSKPFGKYEGKRYGKPPGLRSPFKGKLPKEAIESLIDLIVATKRSEAPPNPRLPWKPGSPWTALDCSWVDKMKQSQKVRLDGKRLGKNEYAVQARLDELALKYGAKTEKK